MNKHQQSLLLWNGSRERRYVRGNSGSRPGLLIINREISHAAADHSQPGD